MILEFIHRDSSREEIEFNEKYKASNSYKYLSSSNKLEYIKEFFPSFMSGQKMVLFDSNHKQLLDFYTKTDINTLDKIGDVDAQLLFFTSGSSGFPVGAFKSKENLLDEIKVLKTLVNQKKIKQVVVTVPFVHIYGVLAGLLLPFYLDDVTLIVKDDFLPYELLQEASCGKTLVITTPVFIKALNKLSDTKNLSSSIFVSSTGPLHSDDVLSFEKKYQTTLLQLFGSTETGGIAYKFSNNEKWTALDTVKLSVEDEKLNVASNFLSRYLLEDSIKEVGPSFTTEDLVDLEENEFTLLGRANKLIKIAGKRISTTLMESILEEIEPIKTAIIEVVYDKNLFRSEQILIILEATKEVSKKEIKEKLMQHYGLLTISFRVKYVEKISYSGMDKKIYF